MYLLKNWWWSSSLTIWLTSGAAMAQQKQGAIWRLGNYEINFNQIPRTITPIPGYPASARSQFTYCDKNGRLLCSINNRDSLLNRFGGKMPSFQSYHHTAPNPLSAGSNYKVFVPDPGNLNRVYLLDYNFVPFQTNIDSVCLGYLLIDFRLDSGRGDVVYPTRQNIPNAYVTPIINAGSFEVLSQPWSENFLIIYYNLYSRRIVFRRITESGIGEEIFASDTLDIPLDVGSGIYPTIRVSSDGKYLALNLIGDGDIYFTTRCTVRRREPI